jgi:hypothetical protein
LKKEKKMQTAVIQSGSEKEFAQIIEFAKNIGAKIKVLSKIEEEDIAFGLAIKEGRKGDFVDTNNGDAIDLAIPEWQKKIVLQRKADAIINPETMLDWEQVKNKI